MFGAPEMEDVFPAGANRLAIDASPLGRKIVDRGTGNPPVRLAGRAALLTIENGAERFIHIDGTDAGAIESLVHIDQRIRSGFPDELATAFSREPSHRLFSPWIHGAQAVVFHESLPVKQTAMNGPQ